MPIRMTGMNSGLDTDRIIQELVRGQKTKVDNLKRNQTSLQWKQDAWKDLNSRALKLHGMLNNMRFSDAYTKKTSKVSNNSKVSVVTGDTAAKGVQNLEISKLATSGILTGAKITKLDGKAVGANTKLSEILDFAGLDSGETSFTVKTGGREQQVKLNADTRVQDIVNQFKGLGLNANFDTTNGRLFVSSQKMGAAGDFSLVADNENGFSALSALGINVFEEDDYRELADTKKFETDGVTFTDDYKKLLDAEMAKRLKTDTDAYNAAEKALNTHSKFIEDKIGAYKDWLSANDSGFDLTVATDLAIVERMELLTDGMKSDRDTIQSSINAKQLLIDGLNDDIENESDPTAKATLEEQRDVLLGEKEDLLKDLSNKNKEIADTGYDNFNKTVYGAAVDEETRLSGVKDAAETVKDDTAARRTAAEAKIDADINFASHAVGYTGNQIGQNGAARVYGEDAEILLNGAKFTNSTNTFNINGLTINATQKTEPGEIITITTEDDTSGIYDVIKNFIKEYNALINEMDRLYNAESARDFKPLTDEEKDAMSEREIADWEKKIKDSVLRRDDSLSGISGAMKQAMSAGVMVNGKNMYLNNFGIEALSFFASAANEKNAYWIDGDPDSIHTSGKTDKLREMIANDPKTVSDFFSGLSRNLYAAMDKSLMSRGDFKSINTIYNDKQLKKEYDNFTNLISRQEQKLTKLEDKYYKQFSAMEVAMAKMQSSQNALAGLMGFQAN
ncbi:MAG: flagellar filament capping protein FliD [Lachnospiraceae bacterium]|nr:flagellar filament capping protein FliD [Lachnospiraceae bacterium]